MTGAELYLRGAETLRASWEQYARGATGASVRRLPGVAAAVFPNEPGRSVYNNALLERDVGASERADAIAAMEAAYEAAGVTRFAAWGHESDAGMSSALARRGYTVDEVTRAMGMTLDHIRPSPADIRLRRGLRDLQRRDARVGSSPWTGDRVDRDPPARCARTRMPDGEPAVR